MTDYAKLVDYAAKDNLTAGNPSKIVRGTELGAEFDSLATVTATKGDKAVGLSQFAATTSAQLAGVISDETGSGALVFATSPTLVTPILGTPTSGVTDNLTTTTTATAIVDTDFVDTNLAAGGKRKILWTAVKTYLNTTFAALAGSASQAFSVAAATVTTQAPATSQIVGALGGYSTTTGHTAGIANANTYTNTTTRPLWVTCSSYSSIANNQLGYINGAIVMRNDVAAGTPATMYLLVSPGATYAIGHSSGTITNMYWNEY